MKRMKVIKNPLELQERLELLINQWKIINSKEVNNKAFKLQTLSNWISMVNNELNEVNNIVIKSAKVNNLSQ